MSDSTGTAPPVIRHHMDAQTSMMIAIKSESPDSGS
jgi:hypothetical protein